MSSDPSPLHARIAQSFHRQGLMHTLGARLLSVQPGEVQIELPCQPQVSQQQGFVHGGAVATIADSASGYAALTLAGEGEEVVTAEYKVNLMRPALGERLVAIGRVVNAGRTLSVCSAEVFAHQGEQRKLVAVLQATMVLVKA